MIPHKWTTASLYGRSSLTHRKSQKHSSVVSPQPTHSLLILQREIHKDRFPGRSAIELRRPILFNTNISASSISDGTSL